MKPYQSATCTYSKDLSFLFLDPQSTYTQYIFQHDDDGDVMSGSLAYVLANTQNASEIKIVLNAGTNITSFDTIFSTPTPAGHICAQSVFNYRTDNTSGSLKVYRQIYLLCSNGDVHLQEWLVGDHPKITDVVFQSGLTWYIHYIETIPLISVQDTGMIGANGNQTALAESIRHGADVYITYASQHRLLSSVQFEEYVTGVYGTCQLGICIGQWQ